MGNNSFILTEEEKKRIKKLHEATTAAVAGSYNQPMGFTEPVEELDIETTFIDGDNIQDGSEEITLDIEDIAQFLEVTEEDERKRMRKLHKENSIIKEQQTAASSKDSEGNETFTWSKDGEDNVIFKSSTYKPEWWHRVGGTDDGNFGILVCDDCSDKNKTELDKYKLRSYTHNSSKEAYDKLGAQLNMDLSGYESA